jgi:hypothetical protein
MITKLTEAAGKLRLLSQPYNLPVSVKIFGNQSNGEGKKDPKLLTSLAKRLESREPIFKPKE